MHPIEPQPRPDLTRLTPLHGPFMPSGNAGRSTSRDGTNRPSEAMAYIALAHSTTLNNVCRHLNVTDHWPRVPRTWIAPEIVWRDLSPVQAIGAPYPGNDATTSEMHPGAIAQMRLDADSPAGPIAHDQVVAAASLLAVDSPASSDASEASGEPAPDDAIRFMRMLSARFPLLTPAELRVCVQLRSMVGSKEIAHALGISVRTVETHRTRIRRKISIEANVSLSVFLLQVR